MTLFKRAAVVAGAVAALVLAIGAPASAHVTVSSANAAQGGYTKATFRVPNESDTASTTKLEVTLPIKDAPVASVSVKPVPGWTAVVTKGKLDKPLEAHGTQIKEAVEKITWTASADGAVKPGQFQEFDVSLGPLPQVDQMVFKALQTYSDGTVVRWIDEPAAAGAEEPESPAPVLKLAKATAEGAAPAAAAGAAPAAGAEAHAESSNTGTVLGAGGLALGVVALIVALLAYRRSAGAPATSAAAPEKVSAGN
jgi:uncharacterized protein YcnI